MLHKIVDVLLAVEASVHDKFKLVEFEEINILNEIFYSLNIRDVACKLSVVYREH